MNLSQPTRQAMLQAACATIEQRLGGNKIQKPPIESDPALAILAGCFVSLHEQQSHALRGCVGLLESDKPLWQTLIAAAENVLKDPRFTDRPVILSQLPNLEIELTVLDPMQLRSSPLDFDPAREGIYLTIGQRAGCFLPQVAHDTGWTKEQLLSRLCTEKLSLKENAWRDSAARLRTFTATILGPQPFFPDEVI